MNLLSVKNSRLIKILSESDNESDTISLNDLIDLYAQIILNESDVMDDSTLEKFICKKIGTYCDFSKETQESSKIISDVKASTHTIINAIKENNVVAIETASKELEEYQTRINALQKEVNTDELTSFFNRRFLLTEKLENSKTLKSDGTMIIFNIPDFRELNHHYGYVVGDSVLKYLALQIKKSLLIFDCEIIRLSGAMFVIFLNNDQLDSIEKRLQNFQEKLSTHKYKTANNEIIKFNFVFSHAHYKHGEVFNELISSLLQKLSDTM